MTRPKLGFIWMVAWPDFRARLRRFLITGFGMALVLSITLLLAGFSEGFRLRAERVLDVIGGEYYVVPEGSSGALTSQSPFPSAVVDEVEGGGELEGLSLVRTGVALGNETAGIVTVAAGPGDPWPVIEEGRGIESPSEIVADQEVAILEIGDEVVLGGRMFTVVGQTRFATWDLATAAVFMDEEAFREIFRGGADSITAVVTQEQPTSVPAGFEIQTRQDAFDDLLVRTADAKASIDAFTITLWVLAVVIVGAILYLAALERIRDFAIFKATGASNLDLVLGLAVQAVMLGAVAGLFAIGLAHILKPIYPGLLSLPISVVWPVVPVAVVIAVLSSVVGVRRAISVDPSQAFG